MSVLALAGEPPATDSERTATPEKRVALGDRLSRWLEDFLTGFVPGEFRIELDWKTLSPIVSTLSGLAVLLATYGASIPGFRNLSWV